MSFLSVLAERRAAIADSVDRQNYNTMQEAWEVFLIDQIVAGGGAAGDIVSVLGTFTAAGSGPGYSIGDLIILRQIGASAPEYYNGTTGAIVAAPDTNDFVPFGGTSQAALRSWRAIASNAGIGYADGQVLSEVVDLTTGTSQWFVGGALISEPFPGDITPWDAAEGAISAPRTILGHERIALNYAEASLTGFQQVAVNAIATIDVSLLASDTPSAAQFAPSAEILILSPDGASICDIYRVVGGPPTALQVRRTGSVALGAQSLVAVGAAISPAKAIALSALNPPLGAQWAEIQFTAAPALLQLAVLAPYAGTQLEREQSLEAQLRLHQLVAAFPEPADLWSDRGLKRYFGDRESLRIEPTDNLLAWRFLALGAKADAWATVTYGTGG